MASDDKETNVLDQVRDTLLTITPAARMRVLSYLWMRAAEEAEKQGKPPMLSGLFGKSVQ